MDLLKEKGYVEVEKYLPFPKDPKDARRQLEAERRRVKKLDDHITRNYSRIDVLVESREQAIAEVEQVKESKIKTIQEMQKEMQKQREAIRRIIKLRDEKLESQEKQLDSLKKELRSYRRSSV